MKATVRRVQDNHSNGSPKCSQSLFPVLQDGVTCSPNPMGNRAPIVGLVTGSREAQLPVPTERGVRVSRTMHFGS